MSQFPTSLAIYLDAAVLKPEMTRDEAKAALLEAISYGVKTVCVRPCDLDLAAELCLGTQTGVCVVLGFPHGDQLPETKAAEARAYVARGVAEIDMVANYGWIRSGLWAEYSADLAGVVAVTKPAGIPLKVIFETSQLTQEKIFQATQHAVAAGVDFVKTSTGFYGEGATEEAVRTMLEAAAGKAQVKPSGGIRDRATAEKFLALGATRLGVGYSSCAPLCGGHPPPGSSAAGAAY